MNKTAEQDVFRFLRKVAGRYDLALNPDEHALDRIARHLADNKARHGRYYCPCKQHFPLQPESDPVCPCAGFQQEIKKFGHCECHLFHDRALSAEAKRRPGLLATVTCPG